MGRATLCGVTALALVVSGCGWFQPGSLDPTAACGREAQALVADVDWSEARLIPVKIVRGEFQPNVLTLRIERPYRLTLRNYDDEFRIFYAPDFLHSLAVGGLTVNDESDDSGCVSQIIIPAGGSAELRLMPLEEGSFELDNTLIPLRVLGAGIGMIHVR